MHKEVCSVDRPKAFQLRTWETRHPKTSNWQPKRFKICILSSLVANEQHATDGWWTHKLPPGDMILYNRQLDETIMDLIQLSKSCVKLEVPTIGPHMERSLRLTDPQRSLISFGKTTPSEVRRIWCCLFWKWYRAICRTLSFIKPLYTIPAGVVGPLIQALMQAHGLKVKQAEYGCLS